MNIQESTRNFEEWVQERCLIVRTELRDKHAMVKQDPFQFLRGTYYRWAQMWPELCPESRRAPVVLSVGDLHIDSFGTWRDAEGRMCWGVDDFDEAWPLAYTNDLVRLAASLKIVIDAEGLSIKLNDGCNAVLEGYSDSLREGGRP